MATIELNATVRATTGKAHARRTRKGGRFPAVLYGPTRSVALLSIDAAEFSAKVMSREGSHLIRFASDGADVGGRLALVKETQVDALSGVPTHADFYEVDTTKPIHVPVPLHFVGKPVGVVAGGILQPVLREVEVQCLPLAIPDYIEVDVTALNIHDSIHVSQLTLPEGARALDEHDPVVVTVVALGGGDAKDAAAEAAPAAAAPAKGGDAKAPAKAPAKAGGK